MKNTVTRKKDIRTERKEMKAMGFQNIKFSTWGHHNERFVSMKPSFFKDFLYGDDKARCDWAKKFCLKLTDGFKEEEILALEIDGIKLIGWGDQEWIDGSKLKFNLKDIA